MAFTAILSAMGSGLSATVIPVSDPNIQRGLSPYNWAGTDGSISATVCGASLQARFRGTRHAALKIDTRHVTTPVAARFPIIAWSVNGGPVQSHQLSAGENSVILCSDIPDPAIDFYVKGMSPFEDRFSGDVPPNSVKITGFEVDEGATTKPAAQAGSVWLNIGDSIMSGDGAAYAEGQGRPPDDGWAASDEARASYGYLLAEHFGFRETRLAYGGYDWGGGGGNTPALTTLIDQKTSTVSRLIDGALSPAPAVVLINLGENGVPADKDVIEALGKIRARAGKASRIIVMIPVSGKGRIEIARAFNDYKKSARDDYASLIDLGPIKFATADGQHPTAAGHKEIYEKALPAVATIVGALPRSR